MAVKTLICGLSGTGKSRSMKPFAEAGIPVAVVNPVNKPLPFRNKFEMLNGETDARKIMTFMKKVAGQGIKHIVVDDFQYLLSIPYMSRIRESGWDKYNDFAANYYQIIDVCNDLPNDITVYFMTHTETLEDGQETVKLIGKLLREKICIEGLFTIVLKTLVADGKYYFVTQNNGRDNVKSPEDMFPSYAIDNDLKYVDDKIRNYYEIGEFLTDEEMAEIDEEAKKVDVIKDDGKKKRGRRSEKKEEPAEAPAEEKKEETAEQPKSRKRSRKSTVVDEPVHEEPVETEETFQGEMATPDSGTVGVSGEEKKTRTRKGRNEMKREQADEDFLKNAPKEGEDTEVPFTETEPTQTEPLPRRKRRDAVAQESEPQEEAPSNDSDTPAPRRRRRRA